MSGAADTVLPRTELPETRCLGVTPIKAAKALAELKRRIPEIRQHFGDGGVANSGNTQHQFRIPF